MRCAGAIVTARCVNTGSAAHEPANAEFEAAASQLEELGYSHELSNDGVHFSREPVVHVPWESDPGTAGQRHYPELGTRSPLVVV